MKPSSCQIVRGWCSLLWTSMILLPAQTGLAADWPMRGRDSTRNPVVADGVGPVDWAFDDEGRPVRNIRWIAELGHISYADPVVSNGLIWAGTNTPHPHNPDGKEEGAVLICFDEHNGRFLYQYVSPWLPEGRRVDWPGNGHTSSPLIEGDRLWFCNNRHEVICLDIAPLIARTGQPREVWKVDLRREFGVKPRAVMIGSNLCHCSIASYGNLIYINTTNATGYDGKVPAPKAPSLICLEKQTGKLRWQDNSPGEAILDVQHGNPLAAEINGQPQVIMGQGDGYLRGFDALNGKLLWWFDINRKTHRKGKPLYASEVNDCVPMPVLYEGRVYFTTGRHHEIGESGKIGCLDPTKRGDISSELLRPDGQVVDNPNSGLIWEYLQSRDGETPMNSAISSVAVHQGLAFAATAEGWLHCVDAKTGAGLWVHDMQGNAFSTPADCRRPGLHDRRIDGLHLRPLPRETPDCGTPATRE